MADMSHLNPRTIFRETRYPSAAEIARDPRRYEGASPITTIRECARRRLLEAGTLCMLGAATFSLASVMVTTEAPGWVTGTALAIYGVAMTTGSVKYLGSADALRLLRDTHHAFDQLQLRSQPEGPVTHPLQQMPSIGDQE